MFDSILGKVLKPQHIGWVSPKYLDIDIDGDRRQFEILKGADTFLHKQIDIKPATSKEVFKKDEDS